MYNGLDISLAPLFLGAAFADRVSLLLVTSPVGLALVDCDRDGAVLFERHACCYCFSIVAAR